MINATSEATTGTIEAGATISGLGLGIVAGPGGSLNIINNGAVTGSIIGLTIGSVAGNITYSGNGSASGGLAAAGLSIFAGPGTIAVGTADTPVIPNFSGFAGLATVSSTATSIFLNGGSLSSLGAYGLQMQGGDVSATLTGGTTIANAGTAGTGYGIFSSSVAGPTSIASDANIGGAGSSFAYGIMSEGDDSIALSQTGGTIHAATAGLAAISTGDDAVSVDTAAGSSISMDDWHVGAGIRVSTQAAAVNVRAAGTISNTQAGIMVDSVTGAVNVTAAGTISGTQFGIGAQSAGLVNVAVPGAISALGAGVLAVGDNITVAVDGEITAGAVGILAGGGGTHDAQISVGSGATVQGTSLAGVWVSANNSRIDNSGTIVGGIMSGGGSTTVNNAGSITGTSGIAVYLVGGANNTFVMSGPNATLTGQAIGSGTDTFRFAGTGSNTFDVGQIDAGWTLLDKVGSSNWSLTGTSTYAGPVTVNGGTLSVNGDLTSASSISVNTGGALGGNGTVGNTAISGGTLAPGNSVGTLTVNGNLTFNGSSNYLTEVTRAGADKTIVTGTANLDGKVVVKPLAHIGKTTTYTIMTAGTENGAFSGVDFLTVNNFARNPQLTYAGNDVLLTLDPGLLSPALVGNVTPNQKGVAAGIDSAIVGGVVLPDSFDALFALSGGPLRAALSQLSGEIHASARTVLVEDSRFLRDAVNERIRAAFAGVGAAASPVLAYGETGTDGTATAAFSHALAPADTASVAAWGSVFGSWGSTDGDGNAAGLDRSAGGFFTGIDGLVAENVRLGIMTGYSHASFDVDGRASSGSSDSYHLGLYGGTEMGALGLRSGLAYSWHDISTARSVAFPGFADSLSTDYDAGTFQAFGEAGYRIDTASASFEPFANLAYVSLHTDGFAEKGGAAALTGTSQTTGTTFTTLGVRASTGFHLGGMTATARGMVGWRHAFGDTTPLATPAFAFAAANSFAIAGAPIAKDAAVLEAGLDFAVSERATLGLSYTGQFGAHATDNGAKANLSVRF
ncbi:autotransporter domain-containing protein [Mesorhizobium sp. 8]|uniref:autotransporter outer membrane beta-barrel domain-containing protein n=1 Tax=Mesorhizobium sp. 8 TaxID=2584466 RepID=UPI0015D66FAB|nr:autotransporter domain-containing protein [Mesorhizobium sp. 8]